MADIFLSYSKKDSEAKSALERRLATLGFGLWSDDALKPGRNFNESIQNELRVAEAVIVIWSPQAAQSDYVKMEAGIAWAWNKLIPVRVPEFAPEFIPEPFRNLQTIEFTRTDEIVRALEARDIRPQKTVRVALNDLLLAMGRADPSLPDGVKTWLNQAQSQGFRAVAKRSIILKSTIPGFGEVNFGTLFPDGTTHTNYISESAAKLDDPKIAADYLDGVARLVPGATVRRDGNPWTWHVEMTGGGLPKTGELLRSGGQWLELMVTTRARFAAAAAKPIA